MEYSAAKDVDRSNIIPMLRRPRGIYYHEYFMLLGITEFTKAYLQVKDNTWPFISLVKLTQNTRLNDNEVLALLKIANSGFSFGKLRLQFWH